MAEIPPSLPPRTHQTSEKGDVAQDFIVSLDLATTIVVPRSLTKANAHNEIERLKVPYKHDRLKGSMKDRVIVLPIAGDVDIATRPVFSKMTKAGGFEAKHHPRTRN